MTYVALIVNSDGSLDPEQKRSLDQTEELAALWERARQKKGDLRSNSPFRCVKCREPVYWRQPVSKDPHFYHAPNSKCPLSKTGSKLQHQRIQSALLRIGQSLGDFKSAVEYPAVDDEGRPRFFDVIWPSQKIAWEVDLTINPKSEQQFRQKLRNARGNLRMFSLVCSNKLRNEQIQDNSIPTIVVRDLSTKVEKAGGVPLESSAVRRVMGLRRSNGQLGLYWTSIRFIDFVTSLEEYEYAWQTGIRGGRRWGWARAEDLAILKSYEELLEEIKANSYASAKMEARLQAASKAKNELIKIKAELDELKISVARLRSDNTSDIRSASAKLRQFAKLRNSRLKLNAMIAQAEKLLSASKISLLLVPFRSRSLRRNLSKEVDEVESQLSSELQSLEVSLRKADKGVLEVDKKNKEFSAIQNRVFRQLQTVVESIKEARQSA